MSYEYGSPSKAPLIAFFGVIALSIGIFFLFTLPQLNKKEAQEQASVSAKQAWEQTNSDSEQPAAEMLSEQSAPPMAQPRAIVEDPKFANPGALAAEISTQLSIGNWTKAATLMQPGLQEVEKLEAVLSLQGYQLKAVDTLVEIGKEGRDRHLWAIELEPRSDPTTSGNHLVLEIEESGRGNWQVSGVQLPEMPGVEVVGEPAWKTQPLLVSDRFMDAITDQDFAAARGLLDPAKVTDERLAALCIVMEEAQFTPAKERPLTKTVSTEDSAWIVAQVVSGKNGERGEMGLAMEKNEESRWRVGEVNLSKLLDAYARVAAEDGDIAYSPMVTTPKGGESIALFFDYNKGELHPRALRQLAIVAKILKTDAAKKIRIGGHADALGTADYNQKLAKFRAASTEQALRGFGVNDAQIVIESFGADLPLSPNVKEDGSDNPSGRRRNRRAEIFLDF